MDLHVDGSVALILLVTFGTLMANRVGHWGWVTLPFYWVGGIALARLCLDAAGDAYITAHVPAGVFVGFAATGAMLAAAAMFLIWRLWVRHGACPVLGKGQNPGIPFAFFATCLASLRTSAQSTALAIPAGLIQGTLILVGVVAPILLLWAAIRQSRSRAPWDLGTVQADQAADGAAGEGHPQ
jgi:hypothetical protein